MPKARAKVAAKPAKKGGAKKGGAKKGAAATTSAK